MKKYLFSMVLALTLTLGLTTISNAEPSFWFSGGGKDGNGSFAIGFGGDNIGIEFGLIDDATIPNGTLDYECPHWDYTSLGDKTLRSSVGFDLIGMFHLSDNIVLYGGPGIYWHETGEVVRSNATGWLYTQTSDTTVDIACSGGVKYKLSRSSLLGVGYHSLRGTNLTFQINL